MKKLFIVNGRAEPRALARFEEAYSRYSSEHPGETEVVFTRFAGHAREAAMKASLQKDILVIACGGDGTVHEVACSLAESEVPMAVIPLGTGNDFTRSVMNDEHRNDCTLCLKDIFEDRYSVKNIDLIKVTSYDRKGSKIEANSAWCINVASIGLDTEVQLRAKGKVLAHPDSGIVRKTAYLNSAVECIFGNRKFQFKYVVHRADGKPKESTKKEFTLIAGCNASYYGSGFCPAPDARIDDGLINCCAIDAVNIPRALLLLKKYQKGKHKGCKEMDIFETTELTVEATGSRDLNGNYDGEDFSGHRITFECCPGSLRLALYD